jgi:hypothetical protein
LNQDIKIEVIRERDRRLMIAVRAVLCALVYIIIRDRGLIAPSQAFNCAPPANLKQKTVHSWC